MIDTGNGFVGGLMRLTEDLHGVVFGVVGPDAAA